MAMPMLAKHKHPANNHTSSYYSGNNSEFLITTWNIQVMAMHTSMGFYQMLTLGQKSFPGRWWVISLTHTHLRWRVCKGPSAESAVAFPSHSKSRNHNTHSNCTIKGAISDIHPKQAWLLASCSSVLHHIYAQEVMSHSLKVPAHSNPLKMYSANGKHASCTHIVLAITDRGANNCGTHVCVQNSFLIRGLE